MHSLLFQGCHYWTIFQWSKFYSHFLICSYYYWRKPRFSQASSIKKKPIITTFTILVHKYELCHAISCKELHLNIYIWYIYITLFLFTYINVHICILYTYIHLHKFIKYMLLYFTHIYYIYIIYIWESIANSDNNEIHCAQNIYWLMD